MSFRPIQAARRDLKPLNKGYTDIAWSHLFDPKSGEYNIPFLPTYLPNVKAVVVNLFYRDLGFLVAPKNPFISGDLKT